jgi:hypothetical protein
MYEKARHELLLDQSWDESRARDSIQRIAAETDSNFDPENLWPVHPLDRFSDDHRSPFRMLYFGAAGVIWALHYLNGIGAWKTGRDYSNTLAGLAEKNRADLNLSPPNSASYLMGDVGILLVQWRWQPTEDLADRIFRAVESNLNNPARELMWGAPGTMLTALFMYQFTRDERWKEAYQRSARQILNDLTWDAARACYVWTQDLYGQTSRYLGAVHGFAANVFSLVKGVKFLDRQTLDQLTARTAETLERAAATDKDYANWPAALGGVAYLVQHCHGAPGMINCLADLPTGSNEYFDRLLLKGGELIWKAGPLVKGSNLCHGTAGNGYAFLKLYRRTGQNIWLERARAFAMHAINQYERHANQYGQLRYSLWTGDLGLAIYLWDCIQAKADFATMDVF